MKFLIASCLLSLTLNSTFAAVTPDLSMLHTAKAVKAILGKGILLPTIIDVQVSVQESIPPKNCILVVYNRVPNTTCPGAFGTGPYLDKSYAACFDPTTDEVDSVYGVENECPPAI